MASTSASLPDFAEVSLVPGAVVSTLAGVLSAGALSCDEEVCGGAVGAGVPEVPEVDEPGVGWVACAASDAGPGRPKKSSAVTRGNARYRRPHNVISYLQADQTATVYTCQFATWTL